MPFLAQMNQLLFARLRNAEQRWEANDLIDIMFLSCAAGYADVLVGERATIGYLRQARAPRASAVLAARSPGRSTLCSRSSRDRPHGYPPLPAWR